MEWPARLPPEGGGGVSVIPFIRVTSLGSLMMVFTNVPSTTFPGITHAFFLSEHHISNSCLDNPL